MKLIYGSWSIFRELFFFLFCAVLKVKLFRLEEKLNEIIFRNVFIDLKNVIDKWKMIVEHCWSMKITNNGSMKIDFHFVCNDVCLKTDRQWSTTMCFDHVFEHVELERIRSFHIEICRFVDR